MISALFAKLFDPDTFSGNVFATVVGVAVVALLSYGWKWIRQEWAAVHMIVASPLNAPRMQMPWEEPDTERDRKPIRLSQADGHLSLTLSSRVAWTGGPIQVAFRTPRIGWLPGWLPFNISGKHPRVAATGIGIDPKLSGEFSGSSSGYLSQHQGAYWGTVCLHEGTVIPAGHEIDVTVPYEASESWKGLVVVRQQISDRWFSAFYPVEIALPDGVVSNRYR